MKTLSMDSRKQICRSIGIVDLDAIPEGVILGEHVMLDYAGQEELFPGAFVRIDRELNLGFIQILGIYGLVPKI